MLEEKEDWSMHYLQFYGDWGTQYQ
uniref:Putative LOC101074616 [Takifugu rubripes] n=1 Tax=Lepeophtheirus salmonis TaxID=72036 RepID=A0A0K2ULU6_LEPSM